MASSARKIFTSSSIRCFGAIATTSSVFYFHPMIRASLHKRVTNYPKRSFSLAWLRKTFTLNPPEERRSFPTSGFDIIDPDEPVEEEEVPYYRPDRFYPVRLGEVFQDRYQTIAKLGFGSSSTIWLARDLKDHQYVALKAYVHTSLVHPELPVYSHMSRQTAPSSHQGQGNIWRLLDSFEVSGPGGKHPFLVVEAAQMSLRDMKVVFRPDGFDEELVKGAIIELLKALNYLHSCANVIHTDVHPGNILLGTYDNDVFRRLEETAMKSPVPRKPVSSTRAVYLSRIMKPKVGPMLLSDFGEARIGPGPHAGDIMPLQYRVPETLLYVQWSYPVDIWSVGLTPWDLLGTKVLFTARDENGDPCDSAHLAQLIAELGQPPPEFLAKNPKRASEFWNNKCEWLGLAPIPESRTLESLESRLEDKSGFLRFLRRTLTWMPEQRATAKELLEDPWLAG